MIILFLRTLFSDKTIYCKALQDIAHSSIVRLSNNQMTHQETLIADRHQVGFIISTRHVESSQRGRGP